MLRKATPEDIKKYGEFAYSLALDPAKSCYPTYADGIKTKTDFFKAAERAIAKETYELLLFRMDGNVEGWISYYWIPEDKYLQLYEFNISRGAKQALTELIKTIETKFAGYTAYFGFPGDNQEAIHFLADHGFQCIEQDWNNSFFFDGYTAKEYGDCIEKIFQYNFDKFRRVYHEDPETYWNADRIFEALDDWTIFVYNQGDHPIAAVFLTGKNGYYEIYGSAFADEVFDERVFRELLTASLSECKRLNAKYLTYFCGEDEKPILSELGFKCVGQYVLYIKNYEI